MSAVASAALKAFVPVSPEAVGESSLQRAMDRLTAETGLTFPRSRRANLRRALSTATAEAGVAGVETLLDELDRQPPLLDRLVSLVTIGETYFFRHPEQLEVLSRRILPSLIAAKAGEPGATVRAWSAGCSTGEEAYSLAILIDEALGSRPVREFRVVATDIDRDALREARGASYGRWSFRAELEGRARWFDEEGARRRVRPDIADRVAFSAHNLSCEDAGPPPGASGPLDLILCRNVTMYLSKAARERVANRFLRALAPGGWLIVAPVEVSSTVYAAFDPIVLDGLTLYRRPPVDRVEEIAARPTRSPSIVHVTDRRDHRRRQPDRAPRPKPAVRMTPAARMAAAHRYADLGLLGDARREAELAVGQDPRNGAAYRLLASIADAQDDLTAAAAALRRVVYLDRADALAQFQLGLLEWRMGRNRQARARLVTALGLIADRPPDETVDHGSGLTVRRIRDTAELLAGG